MGVQGLYSSKNVFGRYAMRKTSSWSRAMSIKTSMHPVTTKETTLHRLDRLDMLNPTIVQY